MKVRRIYNHEIGTVEEIPILEEVIDVRDIDFTDGRGTEPLTPARMRAQIASLEKALRAPREMAIDMLLAYGQIPSESRALGETTDSVGGVLVANTKPSDVISAVSKTTHPILTAATLFQTATGGECVSPIDDDFADSSAAVIAENSISDVTADIVFAGISWPKVQNIRCGFLLVPIELPNLRVVLPPILGRRLGRRGGALAVTAVAAGADVGLTAAGTMSVTLPELKSLKASLDAVHQASSSFCMNPLTYDFCVGLTTTQEFEFDTEGFPLLLGKRCYLESAMPVMAASAKAISYGDHSALIRREVNDSMVLRSFPERFAERGQSCYELSARIDFALAKGSATPVPVKVLVMHS